jgi:hypothetical protein
MSCGASIASLEIFPSTTLSLDSFTLLRPLAEVHFATAGAFSSMLTGGNLGPQVFRNFIIARGMLS